MLFYEKNILYGHFITKIIRMVDTDINYELPEGIT